MKRKFTKDEMLDFLEGNEGEVILDEIEDTSRWSVHHHLIFKFENKFWSAYYSRGATEQQDESPWEYETEVECVEVEPVEKVVTVYQPVKD